MGSGWSEVLAIADEQWGLVTKQQVDMTGVAWSTLARRTAQDSLERVAHGVYRVRGGGEPDHVDLRAAWLQLDPRTPAWDRTAATGVVSHRSAAALYGVGHLPADTHEFTLAARRQTRRKDVRLHRGEVGDACVNLRGLPVTRPSRIAADLLADREDPGAVAQVIIDALRPAFDDPGSVASAIAPYAAAHGLPRGDGIGLLLWLLELTGDSDRERWAAEAAETNTGDADRA
ncbi:type IV toxin-antitoxin system AbiEi family antitoxin domain-containing protein [Paractinoplanes maris]|uniref:type IV toxin-antitoxin system AbiEi family antitoxin domain-containing protein n=1 Tax=Paractinoplanes maris TaxID=1734446 RepID=UPI0020227016|nr:type IV toxin-antitoxin system AbiEi family antitoxin domain-containing protein [Actinoplanes maris]